MPATRRLTSAVVLAASGALLVPAAASAAKLESGSASFTLDAKAAQLVQAAGVTVTGADGAVVTGRTGTLPVTGGRGFLRPRSAVVRTGGALDLAKDGMSVRLEALRLAGAGRTGVVSTRIAGTRYRIATVRTPKGAFARSGRTITLKPVPLRMTATAANLVRAVFPGAPVKAGQRFGTLSGSVTLAAPKRR